MPTGAWLEDEIFVLGVWGLITNKRNMKSRGERDFLFCAFVYTKAVLAKECLTEGDF